jgi:hypothetical protein
VTSFGKPDRNLISQPRKVGGVMIDDMYKMRFAVNQWYSLEINKEQRHETHKIFRSRKSVL